jgi:two-component system sensor histidine kinase/response regulator
MEAFGAGVDAVMLKPVNPSVLFDTVMQVLGSRSLRKVVSAMAASQQLAAEMRAHPGAAARCARAAGRGQRHQPGGGRRHAAPVGPVVDIAENGLEALDRIRRTSTTSC